MYEIATGVNSPFTREHTTHMHVVFNL